MNLFVFGLGYTARAFIEAYGGQFAAICGTVRSEEKARQLSHGKLEVLSFSAPQIAQRLAAADVILVSVPPREEDVVLRHYSNAIAASPAASLIYLSTVGVYPDQHGGWVDEDTEVGRDLERARTRIEAEQAWLDFGVKHGRKVIVLRLAGIYGPGNNVLLKLRDGTARRVVKQGQVFNRIHVADIAQALMAAIQYQGPLRLFNISDDEPAPPQDVVTFGAGLLGMTPPAEIAFETATMSEMGRSFYSKNQRVRNVRLRTELGVSLLYPTYREGLKALAQSGEGR